MQCKIAKIAMLQKNHKEMPERNVIFNINWMML